MVVTPTDTTRYTYDYRNLLTTIEDGTNRIEYVYDGRGDRVAQYVNGVRTNYVNDPNCDYTQVLAELDAGAAWEPIGDSALRWGRTNLLVARRGSDGGRPAIPADAPSLAAGPLGSAA